MGLTWGSAQLGYKKLRQAVVSVKSSFLHTYMAAQVEINIFLIQSCKGAEEVGHRKSNLGAG